APTPSQLTRVLFTKVPSGRYKCCLCNKSHKVLATPTLFSIFVVVPADSHYLGPKASVVKAPDFESGLVNVLCGKEKKLTQAEQRALSCLRRAEAHPTNRSSTAKLSFADRLLQSDSKTASRFIDLR
ncbi:hypothetical protein JG687_00010810, partial [Phytophthora cactorum]